MAVPGSQPTTFGFFGKPDSLSLAESYFTTFMDTAAFAGAAVITIGAITSAAPSSAAPTLADFFMVPPSLGLRSTRDPRGLNLLIPD